MRGEYGLKQDNELNEKIHPNMAKLHKELMARPKLPDWSHGLFLKTEKYNKLSYTTQEATDEKQGSPGTASKIDVVKVAREPTADEYFDMIPDEPINRDACAQKKVIQETYSYNKESDTIPA